MASLDLLQSTRKQTNKATDMKVSAGFVHFHPLPHSKPKPPATFKWSLGGYLHQLTLFFKVLQVVFV